jgi:hypothetical protein
MWVISAVTNHWACAVSSTICLCSAVRTLLGLEQQPVKTLAESHSKTKIKWTEISEKCCVLKIGICTYTDAAPGTRARGPSAREVQNVCVNASITRSQ